jgi:membrane peptidoglycan carboxypeptidase
MVPTAPSSSARPGDTASTGPVHRGRRVNVFQALALLLAFLLTAGVGGVLAAGLVMPAVATTSTITDSSVELFEELPTELEPQELSQQSRIWSADGTLLATFFHRNRIVVPLSDIAPIMQQAVIAVEDRRFYEHAGVDVEGMGRALRTNLFSEDTEGGSTLTQQYVKNVLIDAADTRGDVQAVQDARVSEGTAGIARKLEEAKLAIALEKRMSKQEILEGYLNIAQFGPSVYGVESAARYYFSVSAKDLNYLQAATIAGITQAPGANDPVGNPERAQSRRNTVLATMLQQGDISQEEYDAGIATPLVDTLAVSDPGNGCVTAGGAAYFCDYVTKVIAQSPEFGETSEERRQLLLRGGLDVYTTLDLRLQAIADEEVRAAVPDTDPSGLGHAITTIEPGTGKILAMAQNRVYNPREATEPVPGETAVNYNADFAYGSSRGFQPGSTFKPFILAEWLRQGKSLNQLVDGERREYDSSDFTASCDPNLFIEAGWRPNNFDGQGRGRMSVLQATANSINTAYMSMVTQLDLCAMVDTAEAIGFHNSQGNPVPAVPSIALGSVETSPMTMASAFATFAANGVHCEPIAITRVTDRDGNDLPVPGANCRQAIDPSIASTVTYALQQVMTNGSGRDAQLPGRPSAGKTGTTNENWHTWFVGYTPQMSTAVWLGNPRANVPQQRIEVNGRYYRTVFGSSISAPTWDRYMTRAHEGVPVVGFPEPNNRLLFGEQVTVPNVTGRSAQRAVDTLQAAGFSVRVSETPVDSPYPAGTVAYTDPAGGSRSTVGSLVTIHLSTGRSAPPPPADPAPAPPPGQADNPGRGNGNNPGPPGDQG